MNQRNHWMMSGVWAAGIVSLVCGCASSDRMVRLSGLQDTYEQPDERYLTSSSWKAQSRSENRAMKVAAEESRMENGTATPPVLATVNFDEEYVNAWPMFYNCAGFTSILWPMIDYDRYGMAVRPFFNQEGDEYSICFPLCAWNPVNGEGWGGLAFWDKDYTYIFPTGWRFAAGELTGWGVPPLAWTKFNDYSYVFPLYYWDSDTFVSMLGAGSVNESDRWLALVPPLYIHSEGKSEFEAYDNTWIMGLAGRTEDTSRDWYRRNAREVMRAKLSDMNAEKSEWRPAVEELFPEADHTLADNRELQRDLNETSPRKSVTDTCWFFLPMFYHSNSEDCTIWNFGALLWDSREYRTLTFDWGNVNRIRYFNTSSSISHGSPLLGLYSETTTWHSKKGVSEQDTHLVKALQDWIDGQIGNYNYPYVQRNDKNELVYLSEKCRAALVDALEKSGRNCAFPETLTESLALEQALHDELMEMTTEDNFLSVALMSNFFSSRDRHSFRVMLGMLGSGEWNADDSGFAYANPLYYSGWEKESGWNLLLPLATWWSHKNDNHFWLALGGLGGFGTFNGDESRFNVLGVIARGNANAISEDFRILEYLYNFRREGDNRQYTVFPFITVQKAPEKSRYSFLWRLFSIEHTSEGTSGYLCFFPF